MKSLINRDADVNSASSPIAPTTPDATNVTPTTPTDAAAPVTPQSPTDATTPPVEQAPATPSEVVAPTVNAEMKIETPQPPTDIPATVELEQFEAPQPINEPVNFDSVVEKFKGDLQNTNQLDSFKANKFCEVSTTNEYSFVLDGNKVTATEFATGVTKEIALEYAKNLADVI